LRWAGLILAVLLLIPLAGAQPWWSIAIGNSNPTTASDGIYSVGAYYIVGKTNESGIRPFLVALNQSGNLMWGKLFGFTGDARSVLISDTNIIVVGNIGYPQHNGTFVVALTPNGTFLWGKSIPHLSNVEAVYNGGIFLAGTLNGSTTLVKLDGNGNVLWAERFPHSTLRPLLAGFKDGVVLLAGTQMVAVTGKGNVLWSVELDGEYLHATALWTDSKGYIYVSGSIRGQFSTEWYGELDGWLMKLSPMGNKTFGIKIGSEGFDIAFGAFSEGNRTVLVGSSVLDFPEPDTPTDPKDAWDWIAVLDPNGGLRSVNTFNILGRFYYLSKARLLGSDILALGRVWINEETAFKASISRVPSGYFPCPCPKASMSVAPDGVTLKIVNVTGEPVIVGSLEFTPEISPWNPEEKVLYSYRLPVIIVHSNPTNATVIIDGKIIGKTPLSTSLNPGNHTIVVMKDGYIPYNHTFSADLNQLQNLTVNLVPERTELRVSTVPSGALIKVDGKLVGRSPLLIEVEPGRHVVSAEMRNYLGNSTEVDIPSGESVGVFLRLNPLPCRLRVLSRPNATVYIAEKTLETPLDTELSPGNYTLKLSRANYTTYSRNLTCTPNGTVEISVNLTPVFGILRVITNERARIYVDGKSVGVGNITVNLRVGQHRVVIEGSELKNYTVSVKPGNETVLRIEFRTSSVETTTSVETTISQASGTLTEKSKRDRAVCGPGIILVVSLLILLRRV